MACIKYGTSIVKITEIYKIEKLQIWNIYNQNYKTIQNRKVANMKSIVKIRVEACPNIECVTRWSSLVSCKYVE